MPSPSDETPDGTSGRTTDPSPLVAALHHAAERRTAHDWAEADRAATALAAVEAGPSSWDLDGVVRLFGLSQQERRILEVGVLAEDSVAGHLLLGLLNGDGGPGRPTAALALELAGAAPQAAEALRLLSPGAPLRVAGLVALVGDDVLLSRRVRVPERVLAHAAGRDALPAHLRRIVVEPVELPVDGADTLARALERGHSLVWVHTPPLGAGMALAVAACRAVDVSCLVADLTLLPARATADPADLADLVADLLLECGLRGSVLVLVGAERVDPDALARAAVPVLAVSHEPWDPAWSPDLPVTVRAGRLSSNDRRRLWAPLIGRLDGTADHQMLTAMPLSPEQILTVSRHATEVASLLGEDEVTPERIRTSVRQLGRGRSQRAHADAAATLDDLVLPPAARDEVVRLLDWVRYRDEVVARGRAHGKGGKGTGIAGLFSGPPGTGKTMAAHVVADSLGMDLFQVEVATVVDKYIGETEKNLEKVFTQAESMHAVLFFDEADALFGSRSAVKDAKDRYANQEISYLLQRMEQFDGITLLATNLRGNIDAAFARRLHFMIAFPDPDEATRQVLWERHLAELDEPDPDDPPDLARLAATVEMAGGEIRNIVLSAAYAAIAEAGGGSVRVGMRHLVAAVRREYVKLGRRPPAL